jgi:hypothetical protein
MEKKSPSLSSTMQILHIQAQAQPFFAQKF